MTHHLILGGGSAGCVLAARLSADPRRRVTLVEAGRDVTASTMDAAVSSRFPGRAYLDGRNVWPSLVARVSSTAGDADARTYEQGRLLGGGSAINAMMANRGAPDDFDEWGRLGAAGWSWDACLPYFRKLEREVDHGGPLHSASGPVPIRRMAPDARSPFAEAAFEAFAAAGFARLEDQNGPWRDGFFVSAVALDDRGRRVPTSVAYLTPEVRARPNLEVVTDHLAETVRMEGRRAVGATLVPSAGGERRLILADEVVVSAGAIHGPALLMRSGVGHAGELGGLGIDVRVDLPGVGRNLMEHPMAAVSAYLPRRSRVVDLGEHNDQGTLRFSSSADAAGEGDMHVAVVARSGWHSVGLRIGSLLTWVNKPHSRGRLRLSSPDPRAEPTVDFGLLSDPRDMERLKAGFRLAARALLSPAMGVVAAAPFPSGYSTRVAMLAAAGPWNGLKRGAVSAALDAAGPLLPLLLRTALTGGATLEGLLRDDAALADHLLRTVSGVWHASGTCRMGAASDPGAVTDEAGRVRGAVGLRVCDASIMPSLPRANINTPVIMMSERIADSILSERPGQAMRGGMG